MTTPRLLAERSRRIMVLVYALVSLALATGGYFYYQQEKREIRENAYEQLAAVGKLKAQEIEAWRAERQEDARRLSQSELLRNAVAGLIHNPDDAEIRSQLLQHLQNERELAGDDNVILLAPDGTYLLPAKDESTPHHSTLRRAISEALTNQSPVISDFYRSSGGSVHIDCVAAVRDADGRPIAVCVVRRNPSDYLYPLIQSWPTASRSGETLMIQRDGDGILCVNELRFMTNSALTLRASLSETNHAAVQGALGRRGMFQGEDYRNVPVLADIRPIDGSSWILVSKMDWAEATYEEFYRGAEVVFIVGLFIAVGLTSFGYQNRLTRMFLHFSDAEQLKIAAQEKYRATLYSIGDGVITTDTEGHVQDMNRVAQKLTGWNQEEAKGRPLSEVFHLINEATRKPVSNPADEVLRNGEIFGLPDQALLVSRDGTERCVSDSAAPVCDANGNVLGVVLVFSDQSRQRAAQQALRDSEAELRAVFEQAATGMSQTALNGRFTRVNQQLCEITGYSQTELLSLTFQDITHPDDLESDLNLVKRLLAGEIQNYTLEKRYLRKDGSVVPVSLTVCLLRDAHEQPVCFIGVVEDITERKLAQVALEHSRSLLNATLESTADGILVVNAEGKVASFNQRFLLMWELPPTLTPGDDDDQLLAKVLEQLAEPTEFLAKVGELYRNPEASSMDELVFRDGRVFERYSQPQRIGDRIVGRVWSFRNITRRKRTEEALRAKQALLDETEQIGLVGGWEVDVQSQHQTWTPGVYSIHEVEPDFQPTVENGIQFYVPESRPEIQRILQEAIEQGGSFDFESEIITAKGRRRQVRAVGRVDQARGRIVGFFQDITERKAAEVALQRRERILEAVGVAAARFLSSTDWRQSAEEVLSKLGRATEVSRVVVWQANHQADGVTTVSQRFEWRDDFLPCRKSDPSLQNLPLAASGFARWAELLGRGEVIQGLVRDLPASEQPALRNHHILAIAAVPVIVNNQWWGFMGFDECRAERVWRPDEIEGLRAAAHIFGEVLQRELAEAALRSSEAQFRAMFQLASVGMAQADPQTGQLRRVNDKMCAITGYSRVELLGKRFSVFTHPDDRQKDWEAFQRVMRGEASDYHLDKRYICKDGRLAWVHVSVTVMRNEAGQPIHSMAAIEDITDRKRVELQLNRINESLLGLTYDSEKNINTLTALCGELLTGDCALYSKLEGSKLCVKGHWQAPPDMPLEDNAQGHICTDVIQGSKLGPTVIRHLQETPYAQTDPNVRPAGLHTYVGHPVTFGGVTIGSLCAVFTRDMEPTEDELRILGILAAAIGQEEERRQAQDSVRASQQLVEGVLNAIPVRVFWKDKNLAYLGCNENFARDAGFTNPSDLIGKEDSQMSWRDQAELYRSDDLEVINTNRAKLNIEEPQTLPDGKMSILLTSKLPLRDAAGNCIGVLGTYVDITDRKQAEDAHARLATAVEQAAESIVITDTRGKILYVNPAFEKVTGYTAAEAQGQNPRILKSGLQDAEFYRRMWNVLRQGEVWSGHFSNQRKDGTCFEEEATISPIRDTRGNIINYVAVKRDVTREKQLESQFRQSQKMEAFGQLAGGVAHDFNNILGIIMMQAGLLRTLAPDLPEVTNMATDISRAAERGANLTRQLLLFSRRQTLQPRDLDANEIVTSITKMLRRIVGEDVRMQLKFAAHPAWVHADAGMLDQVLMNLTVNSRDAMPEGGDLLIETSIVDLDEFAAQQSPRARPGAFVCLSVSDTGGGIPAHILPRIFEPFFTTKEVGKGTGLGLATVFGIVQQHDGWVDVYSEPGLGTTFRVYLPRLTRDVDPKALAPEEQPLSSGNETILLVEDESELRSVVVRSLSKLGYRVLEAANGREALDLWERHASEIRLLLTDMVMPGGMNGKELAKQLQQANPALKFIYASGYSVEVAGKDLELHDGVNFLAKPFVMHKLAEILRNQLA